MKNAWWKISLILLMTAGVAAYAPASQGQGPAESGRTSAAVSPQEFGADLDLDYCYSYLASFGTWVDLDPWGYVWCPRHMGYRWRPYSLGHWIWTDYGWTWIDNFEWGWIPFHYGRWGWDDDFGWFWVPGTAWGPAWVVWRSSDLYLGWAPFPPGIEFGAGMDFASFGIDFPGRFWVFIGASHFLDRDIYGSVLPYERNATIINDTAIRNNFVFRGREFVNEGVGFTTVQRFTGKPIERYTIRDMRQPGSPRIAGSEVQIYRPSFRGNPAARPQNFLSKEQARQELGSARIYEPRVQAPRRAPEVDIRRRQKEERKLMEQSQSQELKAIDRRLKSDSSQVQSSAERAKIQQNYQAKKNDMGKIHQSETRQMNERHRIDTEHVRQMGQPRMQAPPPKKKK